MPTNSQSNANQPIAEQPSADRSTHSSHGKRPLNQQSAFLVFEGLDGSGKSTLIQALTEELRGRGRSFALTREPGGTPLAEEIRRLLLRKDGEAPVAATELLLYAASHRAEELGG